MTRAVPEKSPKPSTNPFIMATSSATEPTPSPIPRQPPPSSDEVESSRPLPGKPDMPQPKLRFEIRDLNHPGASVFLDKVHPTKGLSDAVTIVVQSLYEPFTGDLPSPGVRSITLVLKPMDGVAYTTGSELDDEHKEIHFSLDYIDRLAKGDLGAEEIRGVLVHEMVHVWQWNGKGKAPAGLIEGVADFIRLKAGYAPPHWTKKPGNSWKDGYEKTAYFLEFLEHVHGDGKVREINDKLRKEEYNEETFWKNLFGQDVETLWKSYEGKHAEKENSKQETEESKGSES